MSEPNPRTPLSVLLDAMTPTASGVHAEVPPDWLQGRAVYGGLSTALCLAATRMQVGDLPPLRSAQITFVGPASSAVEIAPNVARRGKSTTFVTADMHSERGLATRATFCFGASRDSRLYDIDLPAPPVAAPADCGSFFEDADGRNTGPHFAQHFNSRRADGALPVSDAEVADFLVWMQHKDPAIDPFIVGLVALADALPPAAMARFSNPAPVSSMTWMFDVLTAQPWTADDWWLCRSTAQAIRDGYSSQAMTIWNSAGEPTLIGRQNVAVFF